MARQLKKSLSIEIERFNVSRKKGFRRKAIRAGVPVLVSKSMPTVQSAELAAEYGLQLVCGRKFPKV